MLSTHFSSTQLARTAGVVALITHLLFLFPLCRKLLTNYSFCRSFKSRRQNTHPKCLTTMQTRIQLLWKAATCKHFPRLTELVLGSRCPRQSYLQAVPRRYDQQQLSEYLTSTMNKALHTSKRVLPVQDTNLDFLPSHSMTFNASALALNAAWISSKGSLTALD